MALRLESAARHVLVIRETPGLTVRLHGSRLLQSPLAVACMGACFAAALTLAGLALRGRRPAWRLAVTLALGALAFWWVLELHLVRWSLAIIAGECVLLVALAARAARRLNGGGSARYDW